MRAMRSELFDEISRRLQEIREAVQVIAAKVASGRPGSPEDREYLSGVRTQLKMSS